MPPKALRRLQEQGEAQPLAAVGRNDAEVLDAAGAGAVGDPLNGADVGRAVREQPRRAGVKTGAIADFPHQPAATRPVAEIGKYDAVKFMAKTVIFYFRVIFEKVLLPRNPRIIFRQDRHGRQRTAQVQFHPVTLVIRDLIRIARGNHRSHKDGEGWLVEKNIVPHPIRLSKLYGLEWDGFHTATASFSTANVRS